MWVIKCITKKERGLFDFNFSRDFKWKQTKEPYGYKCVFKNKNDWGTALDITLFNMEYKQMKWVYETPEGVLRM